MRLEMEHGRKKSKMRNNDSVKENRTETLQSRGTEPSSGNKELQH